MRALRVVQHRPSTRSIDTIATCPSTTWTHPPARGVPAAPRLIRTLFDSKVLPLCLRNELPPMCPELVTAGRPQRSQPSPPATTEPTAKCRLENARPEPDFKYFSKRTAARSDGNSIDTTTDHGRYRIV